MVKALFLLNLKALLSGMMSIGGKKAPSKLRIALFLSLMAYVAATAGVLFAFTFRAILEPFYAAGIGWMYFSLLALASFGLEVMSTVFLASAQIFGAKDNESLLSMPIKPSSILAGRFLALLALELVVSLVAAAPALAVWIAGGHGSVLGALFFVFGVLLLLLLSLAASLLLAWILSIACARARRRNILTLFFSLAFLGVYLYCGANSQRYLGELISRGEELSEAFRKAFPPFYFFGEAIASGRPASMALFALWALVPFAAAMALLSRSYQRVLASNRGAARPKYKERALKTSSAFLAFVKKELAYFWSSPSILLNTAIGSVFMLIGAFALLFKKEDVFAYLAHMAPSVNLPVAALISVVLALICSTNILSASLISLEGKYLWIAKSAPVSSDTIMASKICAHLATVSPACLIASLVASAAISASLPDALLLVAAPQTFAGLVSVAGLHVNLALPKLDWINEAQVVKQGMPVIIVMLGSFAFIAALGGFYALLLSSLPIEAYLWICSAVCLALSFALWGHLKKSGASRFAEL